MKYTWDAIDGSVVITKSDVGGNVTILASFDIGDLRGVIGSAPGPKYADSLYLKNERRKYASKLFASLDLVEKFVQSGSRFTFEDVFTIPDEITAIEWKGRDTDGGIYFRKSGQSWDSVFRDGYDGPSTYIL